MTTAERIMLEISLLILFLLAVRLIVDAFLRKSGDAIPVLRDGLGALYLDPV